MIPAIVIFAPTACGKTALTVDLFGKSSLEVFKGKAEIISADSQAVYKHFNIGTAKPTSSEQYEIPHHMIDIADPEIQFGLGDFMENADRLCKEIWNRGKIPVVAGGTGFYIKNFLLGAPKTPESIPEIREDMKRKLSELGKKACYEELKVVDPEYAAKINVNDEYRIQRALEVFYSTGKPLSSFKMPDKLRDGFYFCPIVLTRPKDELYERINLRIDRMFELGLESEIENLRKQGYTKDTPAMKAIGYREFFDENATSDQIREAIKNNSRHYAKKQYTFIRGIPGAIEINADDRNRIIEAITEFLKGNQETAKILED